MKVNSLTDGWGGTNSYFAPPQNARNLDQQNVDCGANSGMQNFDLDLVGTYI